MAETRLGCLKGPPPDAMHMSCKLAGSEPVQNTHKKHLQQQTPKKKHGRTSVDQGQTPRQKDAQDDM